MDGGYRSAWDVGYRLTWDIVSELILIGLVTLFLIVATVWILWHVLVKINPDEATDIQPFLTFIVVVVPFVMLIYFGSAIIIYHEKIAPPWPTKLPLNLSSPEYLAAALIYVGLTVWLWSRWRKLQSVKKE